jgi:hypothetical protein
MARCYLKSVLGDKMHTVLCAAGYDVRWLLRMIAKIGLRAFLRALRVMAAIAVSREQPLGFGCWGTLMRLGHRTARPSHAIAAR